MTCFVVNKKGDRNTHTHKHMGYIHVSILYISIRILYIYAISIIQFTAAYICINKPKDTQNLMEVIPGGRGGEIDMKRPGGTLSKYSFSFVFDF